MRRPPLTSPTRHGVFTAREAATEGWTVSQLRSASGRNGGLERLRRGCFAPRLDPDLPDHEAADLRLVRAAVAATLCARGTSVSHLAVPLLHGLPAWAANPHACVSTDRDVRVSGIHTHQALARPGHFTQLDDVPVTSMERAAIDISREFGVQAGLVVADAALRRGLFTVGDLAAATEELGRHLDVDWARAVLEAVDPLAESPLESRSRWQIARQGLPPPLTQVEIYTVHGEFVGRTDFFWEDGVVGEVDGAMKYTTPDVLAREKWRQERLEQLGLIVVRWGVRDLHPFDPTAERLRRALAHARTRPGDRLWVARPTG